jgi:lipopolysaccharide export system protein LptA
MLLVRLETRAQPTDSSGHREAYRPLRLESADEIENQRIDGRDVMRAKGHVRFSQDTLTARGEQAAFFRDAQLAILVGNVILDDGHRTVFSQKARYYGREKKAVCEGDVIFVDRDVTLAADSLVYFQRIEQLMAQGRVVIFDSSEAITLYGNEGFYDVRRQYARVTGDPKVIQFDSTFFKGQNTARLSRGMQTKSERDSTGEPIRYDPNDQLIVKGRTIESLVDSHRVFVKEDVVFEREKLVSTGGWADFHTNKELLRLEQHPRASYEKSVLTGEVMFVQFQDKEISRLWVTGDALATSEADSLTGKNHRLKAKEITMFVSGRKVTHMEAVGNAYNLYFLENQEGVNEISGPKIILYFTEKGKLMSFRVEGGTEGTYYPDNLKQMVEGKE